MKKLYVLFFLSLAIQSSFAVLTVQVDERSELLSIVCRLAGYGEYVNNNVKSYTEEIDSYFTPYSKLPLIDYAKEIRITNNIAFDAISSLIPFMRIINKKIVFTQDAFKIISEDDHRWNVNMLNKYAVLLNDFYKKTNFNRFFSKHSSFYEITKTRFNETIIPTINLSWFDETFGVNNKNFHILLNLCNGKSNYGPSNNEDDHYAIIGVSRLDSLGLPFFNDFDLQVVIHEFCHSYCNPVCNKYAEQMLPAFEKLFPYVSKTLIKKAYGSSSTLMYENLTRLTTLLYLSNQEIFDLMKLRNDEQSGFPWMENLYFFYINFKDNREIYPDFESFIPEYIYFMNEIANQIEKIMCEYKSKIPRVVSVFPPNGSTVSSKVKEARILFNVPMRLAVGVKPLKDNPESRKVCLQPSNNTLSSTKRTIIIPISLEDNTKYGCILSTFFRSEQGYDAEEEYEWIFDTK